MEDCQTPRWSTAFVRETCSHTREKLKRKQRGTPCQLPAGYLLQILIMGKAHKSVLQKSLTTSNGSTSFSSWKCAVTSCTSDGISLGLLPTGVKTSQQLTMACIAECFGAFMEFFLRKKQMTLAYLMPLQYLACRGQHRRYPIRSLNIYHQNDR